MIVNFDKLYLNFYLIVINIYFFICHIRLYIQQKIRKNIEEEKQ